MQTDSLKNSTMIALSLDDVFDIEPVVYSFRVPEISTPGSLMTASRPPHGVYHDNALGVIWMLFHQDKSHIGKSQ